MSEQTIGKLAAALSKAQGQIKNAAKDAANPAFKRDGKESKYADLASVWEACREALAANEIAVIQQVMGGPDTVTVSTVLAHSSGESISCTVTGKPSKPDVQGMGSTITYLRRYSLASMVGVAPEDDDGNASAGVGGGGAKVATKAESAASKAAGDQKQAGAAKLFLDRGNGAGDHFASVTAYLDALEGALSSADDANALFGLNADLLQKIQAKALEKKEGSTVGRIKAIFDHLHAGTIPNMAA